MYAPRRAFPAARSPSLACSLLSLHSLSRTSFVMSRPHAPPRAGKRTGEDKKLNVIVLRNIAQEIEHRRSLRKTLDSPIGQLDLPATQRLLIILITALNASYPDYDFSTLNANCFEPIPGDVRDMLNSRVMNPVSTVVPGFREKAWAAINEAIDLPRSAFVTSPALSL